MGKNAASWSLAVAMLAAFAFSGAAITFENRGQSSVYLRGGSGWRTSIGWCAAGAQLTVPDGIQWKIQTAESLDIRIFAAGEVSPSAVVYAWQNSGVWSAGETLANQYDGKPATTGPSRIVEMVGAVFQSVGWLCVGLGGFMAGLALIRGIKLLSVVAFLAGALVCNASTVRNMTAGPLLVSGLTTGNKALGVGEWAEVEDSAFSVVSGEGNVAWFTNSELPEVVAIWGPAMMAVPVVGESGQPAVRGALLGSSVALGILGAAWGLRIVLGGLRVREDIA